MRQLWKTTPARWAIVLLLNMAMIAHAQFSGTSRGADEGVNRPQTVTTDPAILFPPPRDIRLAPGDTVGITIYGADDYKPVDKVSLDGYLHLPMIGPVQVQGLSPHEAEHMIASKLEAAGMYHNPQVSLVITESPNQIATVLGEVHGVVPVLVPKRLFDVLAVAGGLTNASSHIVTIHRVGVPDPIVVDLGNDPIQSRMANVPIFSGDTILVGRTGSIYMVGAVKTPSMVPLSQNTPLTLMQAVSISGGYLFEAKLNDTKIIRTVGTQRTMVNVHLRRVLDGKDPDPVLQADDIVLVPTSTIRAAIRNGGIGTALGVVSLLTVFILR